MLVAGGGGATGGQFIGMQAAVNVHFAREGDVKISLATEETQLDCFYIVSLLLESTQSAGGSMKTLFMGAKRPKSVVHFDDKW